ncbi:MAG TPA: NAD-dependent epimerase/dehydratase family protein [Polaromonas sp.]|uniref:NAD-dependent epimerase/dehydratase family protein n=1 Tax=Polaromonas sp. TaxID=1869339 RepID=UPI002D441F19|nr:NAD-dependent epimerase/dehydratase family protein [Polaromonas sp.]HYW56931.1 NAD-dependent epimerase/dehydratase family protein [Polaromonas sp.]
MGRHDVLLLGGGGFIGTALGRRLTRDGIRVHVLGRQDADKVEGLLRQCATVVHLASTTTPGSSAGLPGMEIENLALTTRLLELVRIRPQTHLIFFSSGGTVYGNPGRLPVNEDFRIAPRSNYGAGKAAQEGFLEIFRTQGHAVTVVRPSNAYGPGQGMKNGFGLVRTMLEHALLGTPVEIWGDGENVRDFIYIDDIVEACSRLIKLPQDADTYNLGSGRGYSVNETRAMVERVTGIALTAIHHAPKLTDVRAIVLDTARAEAKLLWKPQTSLEGGIKQTWKWLQETT